MRCQASWSCSSASGGVSAAVAVSGGCGATGVGSSDVVAGAGAGTAAAAGAAGCALLELLDPERERLAREVGGGVRHLDQRELEWQPRVGALARVLDRDGEQVAQPQHCRRRQLVCLLPQPLARLVGDGQRVRHVAHVLDEQEMAQVLEQVGDEAAEILPLLGELLEEDERAGRVAVDDRVAEPEERVLLDGAEQLQHGLDVDRVPGRGGELVECRDGVAERAPRAAGDQRQRRVGCLDLLRIGDPPQHAHELRQPRPGEDERLAARPYGLEDLGEVGRAEDEDEVGRRFLDQLQERVPGGVRELVRLVEDVDLVAALGRLEDDAVADLADVVDPALRGGVHLDDVQRRAVRDRHTRVADLVRCRRRSRLAVERLGEDARHRGLARAARAGEEVGLTELAELDRVAQRPDDRFLADDVVEVLRPVFAVERRHASIESGIAQATRAALTPRSL